MRRPVTGNREMEQPLLMPVKPNTVSEIDKAKLEEAGVVVFETPEPQAIKLISPTLVIEGNEILATLLRLIDDKANAPKLKSEVLGVLIEQMAKG